MLGDPQPPEIHGKTNHASCSLVLEPRQVLMIDFRPQPPDDEPSGSHLKPPPNYFARRVQLKIMAMVFVFMLVLVMIERVRDPPLYRWMWTSSKPASQVEKVTPPTPTRQPPVSRGDQLRDPLNWLASAQFQDCLLYTSDAADE